MWDRNTEEDQFLQDLETYRIFKGTDKSSIREMIPFIRHTELPLLDYMTIGDLIEFGGYENDTALIIILMNLFAVLEEGSLCFDLDQERFVSRFSPDMKGKAVEIISDFLAGLAEHRYNKIITSNGNEYMPLILDEYGGNRLLYFQKYYVHKSRLEERIHTFLREDASFDVQCREFDNILEEIYSPPLAIRVGKADVPITKDPVQVKAIRLALRSGFSIISGGPGTGKTSLMVNILRCLVRAGIRVSDIILGAPTGRAAQRMTEAVQKNIASIEEPSSEDSSLLDLKGSTLHKILRYSSYKNDFYYRETNPLPASVVILDEVSMVDVVMLNRFLQALDPGKTRLILLGDKDQLPSVEAGSVFADMIPDGTRAQRFKGRNVVLQEVYRSGDNLLQLAKQTNQGNFPPFAPVSFKDALSMKQDRWAFINAETGNKWKEDLKHWIRHQYLSPLCDGGKSFRDLIMEAKGMTHDQLSASSPGVDLLNKIFIVVDQARILSLIRDGIFGCIGINAIIADYLISKFDPSAARQTHAFSGACIMITRNDYSKELFNGDVGVMIKDAQGIYMAFFHQTGTYVSFPVNILPPWELAFAMTVHKSQGSEFDDVLLVLPDDETHRLLTREIVYTGITRAKKRVLIYGSKPALNTALQRRIERQSGLRW